MTGTDIQIQLDAYYEALVANPSGVRSLADLIAFDNANPALEEPTNFTSQSTCVMRSQDSDLI